MVDKDILVVQQHGIDLVGLSHRPIEDLAVQINAEGQPMNRDEAEENLGYRQIIPHITVMVRDPDGVDNVLAFERLKGGKDKRLHNLYGLGFGGHVKWPSKAISPWQMLEDTLYAEMSEELNIPIDYGLNDEFEYQGVLCCDIDPVDRVHLGIWYTYYLSDPEIIKNIETLETEKMRLLWVPVPYLPVLEPRMENWAKIVSLALQHGVR